MRGTKTPDDEGSALILSLIVMTVCGLILASVLTFAEARVKTTVALLDEGNAAATVDGATKAAVAALQNSEFNNKVDELCFGSGATARETLELPNFNGKGDSATVRCKGRTGTGAQSSAVFIGETNKPGLSILTLGDGSTDGLYVKYTGGQTAAQKVTVNGSVFSNRTITAVQPERTVCDPWWNLFNCRRETPPGTLDVVGDNVYAIARVGCVGNVNVVTGPKDCDYGTRAVKPDPRGEDPATLHQTRYELPALPAPAPMPTHNCNAFNGTATFKPGYYNDVSVLNKYTDGVGCKRYIFEPGVYYFDFHNGEPGYTMPSDAKWKKHEWVVKGNGSSYLVAGKVNPKNTSECVKPTDEENVGVRFIFGGNSRVQFNGVNTTICGSNESSTTVPIAIQGVSSVPSGSPAPTTGTLTFADAAAPATPAGFTALQDAKTDNNVGATWKIGGKDLNRFETRMFTASNFQAQIPAGAALDELSVRARYKNTATQGASSERRIVMTVGGKTCTFGDNDDDGDQSNDIPDSVNGSWMEFSGNLLTNPSCNDLVNHIKANGSAGLTATYEVDQRYYDITETVDTLEVRYSTYGYRPQTVATPSDATCKLSDGFRPDYAGSSTGCAAVTFTSDVATRFSINGSVHMPLSAVNINAKLLWFDAGLYGMGSFNYGIVARSLYINTTIEGDLSLAALPADAFGRIASAVDLETYICPKSSTCTPSGEPALRARVTLTDGADETNPVLQTPVPGKRKVTIQSWSTKQ